MAIDESKFGAFSEGGISIERDQRTKARILEHASRELALKRRGTELDDHLSSDTICQRKAVLERLALLKLVSNDDSPAENKVAHSYFHNLDYNPDILPPLLTGQQVVWFGFGYGFQDVILGINAEKAIWLKDELVYVSPDGFDVLGTGDTHEVKTTRRGSTPIKRKYPKKHPDPNLAGTFEEPQHWTIEEKLYRKNPSWFQYIKCVMYVTERREYYLTLAWILGADMETFKLTCTDAEVETAWKIGVATRALRRKHFIEGTLPGIDTRAFESECENCKFLNSEPCFSEVPRFNLVMQNNLS